MPRITVKASGETATLDYQANTFIHPGVVYSKPQLNFVAGKISAGSAPWTTELATMKGRKAGSGANNGKAYCDLTWTANPRSEVGRGSSGSPDQGGSDLMMDMTAALVDALLWAYTGDRARASKCAEILNAWGAVFTKILFDTTTWSDGKLLSGWVGSLAGRAVELLRYTGYVPRSGEVAPNWTNIDRILRDVILPLSTVWHTGSGGNWIASFVDSTMQIGVALSDKATFDLACLRWRRVVPSLFYLKSDVNPYPNLQGLPIVPPWTQWDKPTTTAASIKSAWGNPTSWPNGLEFEQFRDFHHTSMSFAAVANAAETAWHQGVKLWDEEQTRIVTAVELATGFIYDCWVNGNNPPAGWPFAGTATGYATATQRATWEIVFNHYNGRKKIPMPNCQKVLEQYTRPSTWNIDLHNVCDQLTHQGTFAVSQNMV